MNVRIMMKRFYKKYLIKAGYVIMMAYLIFFSCKKESVAPERQEINWNTGWEFSKDSLSDQLYLPDIDDSQWEKVILPHTPQIEPLVVNNQWRGIAWYRKQFTIDNNNRNKNVFIRFEGAMTIADVWINGKHKITHFGGYLPFVINATDDLKRGKNTVYVRLNNKENQQVPPGKPLNMLDFNIYGGLYRNVKMILTDKLYITDPVYINKKGGGGIVILYDSISKERAWLTIKSHIRNDHATDINFHIIQTLTYAGNKTIAEKKSQDTLVKANHDMEITQQLVIEKPQLWHPEHPFLYTLKTSVFRDGYIVDAVKNTIGIRKFELKADGFYINKEKFFIRGTNRHQEYPYIGYALSDEANFRDAVLIKNAGFDLVRLSHYPQSEAFLDACDKIGLMVMNSIPGWQYMGDSVFRAHAFDDCRNMIRRDRNRACVVFWEVSLNETIMDEDFMKEANRILDEEFSDEAVSAGWQDYEAYDLFIPARQHAGPPDYWNNYRNGERPVFIAEYGDWEYYAQNAGFNQTEFRNLKPEERTSRQFRGDGEKRLLQQALNYLEASNSNAKGASTIGHANWLMFDYNRGYADDIEASGICDIFRIPKFSYYFFRSQRPPIKLPIYRVETGPMVYIASYWQPQSSTSVKVFSNCEEVALFVNHELFEKKTHDKDANSTYLKYPPFTFSMKEFRKGSLKAIGYIDGHEAAEYRVMTPEEPVSIELTAELYNIPVSKTGKDYVFLYARLKDKNGTICPINGIAVEFAAEGNTLLIGENPKASEAGIAVCLLQTRPGKTKIKIRATAKNLQPGELIMHP